MHRNNNQAAIQRLSRKMLKSNQSRNRFVVLAILLTTFMIATIFSIGISYTQNYQTMLERSAGTKADLTLSNPTREQREKAASMEGVKKTGLVSTVGLIEAGGKENFWLRAMEESAWKEDYRLLCSDIAGHYPQSEREVMLSRAALETLGIQEPVAGMEISLSYRTAQGRQTTEMVISGWYTNYDWPQGGLPEALLSEEWLAQGEQTLYIYAGSGKQDLVYNQMERIVQEGQILDAPQGFSSDGSEVGLYMALIVGMLALFLVLSGYLLIYNIMYISVTRDIQFYGMLKTIGASSKQIRGLVRRQLYWLALIGIPMGLVLAAICSFAITPLAMDIFAGGTYQEGIMPTDISFHPVIFIGTALYDFFTIAISCRKPARTAGRVSPMEALRYTGLPAKSKNKKGTSGGKLHRMALRNVFRDKKRAVLVFASLFMGVVTLLGVQSFFGSLDVQNYLDTYVPHDFSFQHIGGETPFSQEMAEQVRGIDGVEKVTTVETVNGYLRFDREQLWPILEETVRQEQKRYREEARNVSELADALEMQARRDEYSCAMFVRSEGSEAFLAGEEWLLYTNEDSEASREMVGHELTVYTKDGRELTLPVGGVVTKEEMPFGLFYYRPVGAPDGLIMSPKTAEKLGLTSRVQVMDVDVDAAKEPEIKQELMRLGKQLPNSNYIFESKTGAAEEFEESILAMNFLGGGISLLLILIGVLNFINTMLTGVYNRRRELAIMESVGMTKKQIRRMLTLEGLDYALITTGLIMTLGTLVMEGIGKWSTHVADYAVFHYPWGMVSIVMILLLAVCLTVPGLIYHKISKESVIERGKEGAI